MPITGGLPGHLAAVVTPPVGRDNFGDPVHPDSSSSSDSGSWTVEGCLLAPSTTVEDDNRATRVVTIWDLYAPASGNFPTGATVEVDGITGRVEGTPKVWAEAGQFVVLRRVTG